MNKLYTYITYYSGLLLCVGLLSGFVSSSSSLVDKGTVANAPTCNAAAKGLPYIVIDANGNDDCTVGGGTDVNDCYCDGTVYVDSDNASGGGAPTDATYLTTTTNGTLTNEVVVGATPGGELGGTWSSPTVDTVHSGSSHADIQAAAEATAAAALSNHEADTTNVHGIADTSVVSLLGQTIDPNELADTNFGDFTCATGSCTLNTDSVSANELNATGVKAELEAVLDLQNLQGAVTDAQVPNNITIDLASVALQHRIIIPNDTVVGTVTNQLVSYTGNGEAIVSSAGELENIVGVCVSGCGTSGNAVIVKSGIQDCDFDDTTNLNNYVGVSPTEDGKCHDIGPVLPVVGIVLGKIVEAIVSADVAEVEWQIQIYKNSAATTTREDAYNNGSDIVAATSLSTCVYDGNSDFGNCRYTDGAGKVWNVTTDKAKTTRYTNDMNIFSDRNKDLVNQDLSVCGSFAKDTWAFTPTSNGTCAPNLRLTNTVQTITGAGLKAPVEVTSSPYTLLNTNCGGTIVNNVAAAGSLEVDLLPDMTGCTVCFWSKGGGAILVDPDSTDTILSEISPALSGGDRFQQAAKVGAGFCVEGLSATEILAWPGNGSYSDAN